MDRLQPVPEFATDMLLSAARMDNLGYGTFAHGMRLVARTLLFQQDFAPARISELVTCAADLASLDEEFASL